MMNERPDPRSRIEKINDKLDEFASKASGPDVAYGSSPRTAGESSDDELEKIAEQEGVTLYRHTDGSHEAIDESETPVTSDETESSESTDRGSTTDD